MGTKSKVTPRYNNKLQKEFNNRLQELEINTFSGSIRAEAVLNILLDKKIITVEEHNKECDNIYNKHKETLENMLKNDKKIEGDTATTNVEVIDTKND